MSVLKLPALLVVIRYCWYSIFAVLLAACGAAPDFVFAPPAIYHVPVPSEMEGMWAREGKDNGERIRLIGLADGTVRFSFFSTGALSGNTPKQPLIAQMLRFDETNWLLLDMHKLSALYDDTYSGEAPYRLIRYEFQGPNRLCASEPNAQLFLPALETGKLQGNVVMNHREQKHVTISSTGEDWVQWWRALPVAAKAPSQQQTYCFIKTD